MPERGYQQVLADQAGCVSCAGVEQEPVFQVLQPVPPMYLPGSLSEPEPAFEGESPSFLLPRGRAESYCSSWMQVGWQRFRVAAAEVSHRHGNR